MLNKNITRVVIVEDDDVIRQSFVSLISSSDKFLCIADYNFCEDAIKNLVTDSPQIILMDIGLPGISGIEGIKRIKKVYSQVDIIVVTVHDEDEKVFDALCAGATGYLTKNVRPDRLIESLSEVLNGSAQMSTNIARKVIHSLQKSVDSPLTPRETEVLQKLAKGKSYTMIADDLLIKRETVRSQIKNIYQKLPLLVKTSPD